jgi:hypothetical protein
VASAAADADAGHVVVKWLLVVLSFRAVAHADGGTLRLARVAGPFLVSVFTAPEPLRVGRADISVLVQEPGRGEVVLGATVELRLQGPDGVEQTLRASHALATNRLLQSAQVELPAAGRWRLEITVDGQTTGACDLAVSPRLRLVADQWMPLALPPICVLLFAWRARLSARPRAGRRPRT